MKPTALMDVCSLTRKSAYYGFRLLSGNSLQTIQVPVAAPQMQQTTIPMQIPVQTANGQTILQTVHVPIQTLGMGGMSNVLGQPMLHQLAGLTQPQLTQLQVQSTSPTAPSSVASSQNVTSVNQSQAQTVQSAAGVQSISVPQVQSVQQWAADAATAAALAQAQQQQTVTLQLPNGQIVHGQQVNLGMFSGEHVFARLPACPASAGISRLLYLSLNSKEFVQTFLNLQVEQ